MLESEIVLKSIDDLIKVIEKNKSSDFTDKTFVLNGNFIDIAELINKYNLNKNDLLHFEHNNFYFYNYQFFKITTNTIKNTFATGPASLYGHLITKLNIKGFNVEIRQNPKTSYEKKFTSKLIYNYENQDYVVLDIETTGLDPLIDDIIQIGIFESEKNKFVRYLPLKKQNRNNAKEINKITEKTLEDKKHLSQEEVNMLIDKFDLRNKIIMIWTGKNLFDRLLLEIYFKEHGLSGLENFKFFNAKTLLDEYKNEIKTVDLSKDNIAKIYNIKTKNFHDALEDCKIEKEIIKNLLNKNIGPLKEEKEKNILKNIIESLINCLEKQNRILQNNKNRLKIFSLYHSIMLEKYINYCNFLKSKYGMVLNDYDKNHKKRGCEWIDIHHIDELNIDDIAVKTQKAQKEKDIQKLQELFKYNKHDRLVYANKIEHFLLHVMLDVIRGVPSGGVHYTFGDILKIEIGIFEKNSKFSIIQNKKQDFYKNIAFDTITNIYTSICKIYNITDFENCSKSFWKINEYQYNQNNYNDIIKILNYKLNN